MTCQQYHAGEAFLTLRQDLDWDCLTPHAKSAVLACIDGEQRQQQQQQPGAGQVRSLEPTSDRTRYLAWLRRVACEATPATAAVDNSLVCDRAFAGGRLVSYRHRTFFVIGGSHASAQDGTSALQRWQPDGDDDMRPGRGGGAAGAAAPGPRPGEVPDQSRVHESTALRPLGAPVRVMLSGAATFGTSATTFGGGGGGGGGISRVVRTQQASTSTCPLPPLEGCAVTAYGSCILVHGGVSPFGEATDEMRAVRLQPDPNRPGEYGVYGRVRVEQVHGSGADALTWQRQAWWLPAATSTGPAAAAAAAAAKPDGGGGDDVTDAGSGRGSVESTAGGGWAEASQPCPPPSARYGHHLAVDPGTSRLWLFGGRSGSGGRGSSSSTTQRGAALVPWMGAGVAAVPPFPSLSSSSSSSSSWSTSANAGSEALPADPLPCCYWAQLPSDPDPDPGSPSAATDGDRAPEHAAASRSTGSGGTDDGGGGECRGARSSGGDGSGADDAAFPGGGVTVAKVAWHCLVLRPAGHSTPGGIRRGRGGGGGGASAGCPAPGPALPDPTRAAAVAVHEGNLYVLSSGPEVRSAAVGGSSSNSSSRMMTAVAAAAPPGARDRWWLHRIHLQTGLCELLEEPPQNEIPAWGERSAPPAPSPPAYHADAVAMADDTLPYIYVYGTVHRGRGAAALGGGSFAPALHRVVLRDDETGSSSSSTGTGAAVVPRRAGRWEAVELIGSDRLHVARSALGTASGGAVTLLGGVRDARRGVEAQIQVVAAAAAAASAGGRGGGRGDAASGGFAAAASLARCRRVIAERLRRSAPREVKFAHPEADRPGGKGGGGGGAGAARRPCVALAAALSLYSKGGLFDDFFEELDDGDDGDRDGPRGMTLPGHEPLAVAAAVAWVMGRTHVRAEWEPRFLANLFRVAHCFELWPLQREVALLVGRLVPELPLEQLPPALGLWGELQRLGAVARAGVNGRTVEDGLRLRLGRAASSSSIHAGNFERVMEGILAAVADEGLDPSRVLSSAAAAAGRTARLPSDGDGVGGKGGGGGGGAVIAQLAALARGCVETAEGLLTSASATGGGGGPGGGAGAAAAVGRTVARFACRYGIRQLMFQAMRWWRRQLATGLMRGGGAGLSELLALLTDLQELAAEEQPEGEGLGGDTAAGHTGRDEPSPAKRPRLDAAAAAADGSSCCCAGGSIAGGVSGSDGANASQEQKNQQNHHHQQQQPMALQLRGFLLGELLRSLRPHTAVDILQALPRGPDATGACGEPELVQYVRQHAYERLAALPPAQRLQLPAPFRTPGEPDYEALRQAMVRVAPTGGGLQGGYGGHHPEQNASVMNSHQLGLQGHQQPQPQQERKNHVDSGCASSSSSPPAAGGCIANAWKGHPPPPVVDRLLIGAQPLIRAYDAWQRSVQEEARLAPRRVGS